MLAPNCLRTVSSRVIVNYHHCVSSASTFPSGALSSWIIRSPAHFHTLSCPHGHLWFPVVPALDTIGQGQVRHYAKATTGITSLGKKPSKVKTGPVMEKKKLAVETDTNKLVNYVCGSCLNKEGEDIKLKDDSEYPAWLWELNISGKVRPIEELDPDTDHYWNRVKALNRRRSLQMLRLKKF